MLNRLKVKIVKLIKRLGCIMARPALDARDRKINKFEGLFYAQKHRNFGINFRLNVATRMIREYVSQVQDLQHKLSKVQDEKLNLKVNMNKTAKTNKALVAKVKRQKPKTKKKR